MRSDLLEALASVDWSETQFPTFQGRIRSYWEFCVNKHTARYNPDGSVTLVIASSDPGVGNFLYTAGHERGTMLLRWTCARHHPVPKCRLVKLASLDP